MRTEEHRPILLKDYRSPDWLIETVHLDISLHPTATTVRARLKLKPNSGATPAPLVLDGEEINLKSLKLDGKPLPTENFVATPDKLTIAQPPHAPFELEIETIVDPTNNTQLMGLYRAGTTYCTQCEAEGFRRITYFLDRPDVMAVYTTRIEAEKSEAPVLLSNGNLVREGDVPGTTRHFAEWHDPFPKPSYLFAMVGGQLAHISDTFKTTIRPRRCAAHLCRAGQGRSLRPRHDQPEKLDALGRGSFGREYDLDIFMIVAVSAFNALTRPGAGHRVPGPRPHRRRRPRGASQAGRVGPGARNRPGRLEPRAGQPADRVRGGPGSAARARRLSLRPPGRGSRPGRRRAGSGSATRRLTATRPLKAHRAGESPPGG